MPLGNHWFTDKHVARTPTDPTLRMEGPVANGGVAGSMSWVDSSARSANLWTQAPLRNSTKGASKFCNALRFDCDAELR